MKSIKSASKCFSMHREEIAITGKLRLGEEIHIAFTKKKAVPRLQKWLDDRNLKVKVMPFSAAGYMQIHDYLMGSYSLTGP